jgi:hypothetical protein
LHVLSVLSEGGGLQAIFLPLQNRHANGGFLLPLPLVVLVTGEVAVADDGPVVFTGDGDADVGMESAGGIVDRG